ETQIIQLSLLPIAEYVICFGQFLEDYLRLRIRVFIGMKLDGKFPECLLYIIRRCGVRYPKDSVVILHSHRLDCKYKKRARQIAGLFFAKYALFFVLCDECKDWPF